MIDIWHPITDYRQSLRLAISADDREYAERLRHAVAATERASDGDLVLTSSGSWIGVREMRNGELGLNIVRGITDAQFVSHKLWPHGVGVPADAEELEEK